MPRPLDKIPELVGAKYSVTTEIAFRHRGILHIAKPYNITRTKLIELVGTHGDNFCVHSCQENNDFTHLYSGTTSSLSSSSWRPIEQILYVRYAILSNDAASTVPLRVSK